METSFVDTTRQLAGFGNVVPNGYTYYNKLVQPRADLSLANAYFKWYDIHPPALEITAAQTAESRAFVAAQAQRLQFGNELGFVLLHQADAVLLLLISTWRNTNEVWESVYWKGLEEETGYRPLEFDQNHRGTFCVWELPVVWHERDAWVRFLSSARDEQAKLEYINNRFSGLV